MCEVVGLLDVPNLSSTPMLAFCFDINARLPEAQPPTSGPLKYSSTRKSPSYEQADKHCYGSNATPPHQTLSIGLGITLSSTGSRALNYRFPSCYHPINSYVVRYLAFSEVVNLARNKLLTFQQQNNMFPTAKMHDVFQIARHDQGE